VEWPPAQFAGLAVFFLERISLHLFSTSQQVALRKIKKGRADFKAGTDQ
jgi:hypothetical protein